VTDHQPGGTAGKRTPRGRELQARRNDARILEAALDVLAGDPAAPMSAVAQRAAVGQATLYRRFPNRHTLLVEICRRGLTRIAEAARRAGEANDPWTGLAGFLEWYADSGTLRLQALLGSYDPPVELFDLASTANGHLQTIVDRAVSAGAVRPDITGADLTLIATQLGSLTAPDPARASELRHRYLALMLQALALTDADRLPGVAPTADELEAPWRDVDRLVNTADPEPSSG
jgi:AcrR family transcriptional regulator